MIGNGAASTALAFKPSDIAGLYLWVESDYGLYSDFGTTPAVANGAVSQWNSKTPASINLTTYGAAPTLKTSIFGSASGLLCDGASQALYSAVAARSDFTTFLIVKGVSNTGGSVLSYGSDSIVYQSGTGYNLYANSGGVPINLNNVGLNAVDIEIVKSGNSISTYSDGTISGSSPFTPAASWASATNIVLGGGVGYANCYLGACLQYSSALSSTDRAKVETYLRTKYSTP